jgi:hypothetical protein
MDRRDVARWHASRPSIPLLAISSIVKVHEGATRQSSWAGRLPAPRLSVALLVVVGDRNEKSRLHREAALKRSVTFDGPVHTDESTSMGRSILWATPTRDVSEVASPSFVRSPRSSTAWSCRIGAQYKKSERLCEETKLDSQGSCGSSNTASGNGVCGDSRSCRRAGMTTSSVSSKTYVGNSNTSRRSSVTHSSSISRMDG